MHFSKGILIHYNSKLPVSCRIKNDNVDNFFSVEVQGNVELNISKGDPIVVGLLSAGKAETVGGSVASAVIDDGFVRTLIILTSSRSVLSERRGFSRLATSLYGIIGRNNMVVSDICIKDISEEGLSIYTNSAFEINEQVEIDLFLKGEVGRYRCRIERKKQRYNRQEYGLAILHDEQSMASIKQFIEAVQNYHAELMSVLKN